MRRQNLPDPPNPLKASPILRAMASSGMRPVACLVLALAPGLAPAADVDPESKPLTRLSLEELAGLKVVSVSRRPESSLEAPGAIHVVTAEDIRRTGSVTVPDALRTAPGVQASRIDADEWALAIRGFASRLSRSVLVVVDGRSVWTPLFAGVFWDANDALLEDIEQIEVSRGPGGAVYGANALNGVINVTTRAAADTQGGLLTGSGGNADWQAALRWGGRLGSDLHYRVFGKYAVRDGTVPTTSAGYDDRWDHALGGFRADWAPGSSDRFTFQGDLYNGSSGQPTTVAIFTPPFSTLLPGDAAFRGRSVLGRWRRTLPGAGEVVTQAYFDHTTRHEPHYAESRNTLDFDAQHRLGVRGRHDFVWGASYRRSDGDFDGVPTIQLVPSQRVDDIAGLFVNDEVRLAGDKLRVTAGTKLEWNDYSGWNVQPSGRVAWVAASRHTFWGSATRAVRTSSRVERDVILYSSLSPTVPLFARAEGSQDFQPESVLALEAGYKLRLRRLIVTASAFHNAYRDLATNVPGAPFVEPGTGGAPPRTVIPVRITNGPEGTAKGVETKVVFDALKSWRLQATYTLVKLEVDGPGAGPGANTPRHQVWLTSYLSPLENLDVDVVLRAVGEIPGHDVPAFQDVDARVAYRPLPSLELAVVGANLLDARRPEFGGGFEVERSARLQATLRF
jgi:iron complex outermembrane recepter protein